MYKLFETDEFLKSIGKLQKRDKVLVQNKLKEYDDFSREKIAGWESLTH